jgi:perosamine synthetase
MDSINHIAAVHGLWVVEDAAEAHFATYKGRPVGGLGQIGTFSFFGNKLITCGEGGAITLNDRQLAIRARTLWGQGMDPERRYYFPVTGYNFRLTNVACAILCAQLERADKIVEERNRIFNTYRKRLSDVPGIGFQPRAEWAVPAPWLFCITVDSEKYGQSRDELMAQLAKKGIDTRPFFIPLHTLPPYREKSMERGEQLDITLRLGASGINLPTYTSMDEQAIVKICDVIRDNAAAS